MSLSNPSPRRLTRRGTRTLKAAYAQAQRDVKRMDPAVLAAIGRSKMNSQDLKHLAHANINGLQGGNQERVAQQLNAQAAAQVQATTPASQRTRNPFKQLSNWNQNRKDIRHGKQTLQMAYAQAKSEVKRIDPAVRQGIGRSRVTKQDLAQLSVAQLDAPLRAGINQAAQHHHTQARIAAATAATQPPRQSAGQRVANAVNTASRWKNAVRDGANGAIAKAEKFRTDYNERRQNPIGRNAPATTAPSTSPQPDLAAQKAAQAKAVHAGLNNTMLTPEATSQSPEAASQSPEAGTGRHRAPEAAAAFDGIAPANGAVASKPATQQATTGQGEAVPAHNKHHKPEGQER
ncbi:hypothetical protein GCM10009554_44360 [Kribbella koreensis]|uniref:Uncharacterized protein n=1 Tax=Kribbella koreensis TaxID=57909 RepID=A0ABP4BEI9_9ACTN